MSQDTYNALTGDTPPRDTRSKISTAHDLITTRVSDEESVLAGLPASLLRMLFKQIGNNNLLTQSYRPPGRSLEDAGVAAGRALPLGETEQTGSY